MWRWLIYLNPWQAEINSDLNHLPDRLINRTMTQHQILSLIGSDQKFCDHQQAKNHRPKATTGTFKPDPKPVSAMADRFGQPRKAAIYCRGIYPVSSSCLRYLQYLLRIRCKTSSFCGVNLGGLWAGWRLAATAETRLGMRTTARQGQWCGSPRLCSSPAESPCQWQWPQTRPLDSP